MGWEDFGRWDGKMVKTGKPQVDGWFGMILAIFDLIIGNGIAMGDVRVTSK